MEYVDFAKEIVTVVSCPLNLRGGDVKYKPYDFARDVQISDYVWKKGFDVESSVFSLLQKKDWLATHYLVGPKI